MRTTSERRRALRHRYKQIMKTAVEIKKMMCIESKIKII